MACNLSPYNHGFESTTPRTRPIRLVLRHGWSPGWSPPSAGELHESAKNRMTRAFALAMRCRRGDTNPKYMEPLGRVVRRRTTRNTWSEAHARVSDTSLLSRGNSGRVGARVVGALAVGHGVS
jgi:hypothetical protein